MYCRNCGKEISDSAYVCPNCGVLVSEEKKANGTADNDSGSKAGWGILSFFIPLVGLILFLVWRTERPKTSKVCGICALSAVIAEVVGGIVAGILISVFLIGVAGSAPIYAVLPVLF